MSVDADIFEKNNMVWLSKAYPEKYKQGSSYKGDQSKTKKIILIIILFIGIIILGFVFWI